LGYSVAISNLLSVPPFVVASEFNSGRPHRSLIPIFSSAIVLLFFAYFSDKLRLRWPFILAGLLSSAAGYAINISDASNGAKYFGTFLCIAGSYSSLPGVVAW